VAGVARATVLEHDDACGARPVRPRASVIVPAHNEAERITRTLETLTADAQPGEFDVVVVCNGCTDDTAGSARSISGVRVVDLERASKIAALREGDRRSQVFPRIYLDADVDLSTQTARALVDALADGRALVAGVPGRYDLDGAPLGVQLFYEFRQRLPVFADGIIGAGVYAMSAEGRARFGEWPEVLGDDQFVYRLFAPAERATVRQHATVVEPAPTLRAVVRRGVRVRRGNQQLGRAAEDRPSLSAPPAGMSVAIRRSLRGPRGLASLLVFVAVTLRIRWIARRGDGGDWA
jgi:hypothetical protein